MPQVSVIVPVYKAEAYLSDCVESLLNQTFRDLEIILADDGSPDNCGSICDAYAQRDSRVKVLHQENQGQAAARNHALALAEGEYLCYVDSDDLIHPQTVELLYRALTETGAGISMCLMLERETLTEDFMEPRPYDFHLLTMDEGTLTELFDNNAYPGWVACGKLIRRELVESYPFTPGRVYEDNEAVCHWLTQGKTLALTQEKLYFYRTNPESTTQKAFSLKRLDFIWAMEGIIRHFHGLGYGKLVERLCGMYADAAGNYYEILRSQGQKAAGKTILRSARRLFRKEGVPLTKKQFERLLDAFHPKLIRLYWPGEAAARTLREKGLGELVRKITARFRKGEQP